MITSTYKVGPWQTTLRVDASMAAMLVNLIADEPYEQPEMQGLTPRTILDHLYTNGLLQYEVRKNNYVDAWGMPCLIESATRDDMYGPERWLSIHPEKKRVASIHLLRGLLERGQLKVTVGGETVVC